MFKMVSGGNGRSVYFGKIGSIDQELFQLTGNEWDSEARVEVTQTLNLRKDPEFEGTMVEDGKIAVAMVLPSRKDPAKGTVEEMVGESGALSVINENGNEKVILYGKVHKVQWNQKHNRFTVSFLDIKNAQDEYLGTEQRYKDHFNLEYVSHWLNVSFFDSNKFKSTYNAERVSQRIQKGDWVVMVASKKVSMYEGREIVNYNGGKFFKIN